MVITRLRLLLHSAALVFTVILGNVTIQKITPVFFSEGSRQQKELLVHPIPPLTCNEEYLRIFLPTVGSLLSIRSPFLRIVKVGLDGMRETISFLW